MVLFGLFLTIGCVENKLTTELEEATSSGEETIEAENVAENTELKEFTLEELANYNGNNGTIYVAYQGKVYDVSSDSYLWKNGNHEGCTAGKAVTGELEKTPHGAEILDKYPVVGTLK